MLHLWLPHTQAIYLSFKLQLLILFVQHLKGATSFKRTVMTEQLSRATGPGSQVCLLNWLPLVCRILQEGN